MPKGPRGEWRPADPVACAVHIGRLATVQIEETFETPAEQRRPRSPSEGGRARAAAGTNAGTVHEVTEKVDAIVILLTEETP